MTESVGALGRIWFAAVTSSPYSAGTSESACPSPRLRTKTAAIAQALTDGYDRSATFRKLVGAVESSDLVVDLVSHSRFAPGPRGMLWFLSAAEGARHLRIELDERLPPDALTALLGHELHHADEIAGASRVRDLPTLRQFYRDLKAIRCDTGPHECYDTIGATQTGWRVLRELARAPRAS